jgi:hypothetical protein
MIGISYLAGNHSSPILLTDRGFLMNIFIGIIRFNFALLKLEVDFHIGFNVEGEYCTNIEFWFQLLVGEKLESVY